ncbi:hypothetical protein P691DRAFT_790847 [Macrolepiota fuliginosa MF-IS2]|uniref:Uncharacterized protein n=1 Tax=Macrolepiota fuliginosa MF-IS2 TaxID=1400762 RepID=A0A9P6BXF3_9AGAR|nr:hypothetical protein P691DRAFT_790847 [Macrolepiota fuliginosa MF-IS2]
MSPCGEGPHRWGSRQLGICMHQRGGPISSLIDTGGNQSSSANEGGGKSALLQVHKVNPEHSGVSLGRIADKLHMFNHVDWDRGQDQLVANLLSVWWLRSARFEHGLNNVKVQLGGYRGSGTHDATVGKVCRVNVEGGPCTGEGVIGSLDKFWEGDTSGYWCFDEELVPGRAASSKVRPF